MSEKIEYKEEKRCLKCDEKTCDHKSSMYLVRWGKNVTCHLSLSKKDLSGESEKWDLKLDPFYLPEKPFVTKVALHPSSECSLNKQVSDGQINIEFAISSSKFMKSDVVYQTTVSWTLD